MDTSAPVSRPLAWSCYAIGVLLVLAPLADLVAGLGAATPGGVPWRFGAIGLLSGALVIPMLGLGLCFAGAVILEHRLVLRLLSVLGVVLLLVIGVLLGLFALDTLQVRLQVPQEAKRAFDLAALKAAGTLLLEVMVLAVLAVNTHRAAAALAGRAHARKRDGTPLVVQAGDR